MVWLASLWYPSSDTVQRIEEPKCLTTGMKDAEDLKKILSDVILKTSDRELYETLEAL